MANSFLYTATVMFAFLAWIWNRKDWYNFFLKFLLTAFFVWGALLSLVQLGFVIRR